MDGSSSLRLPCSLSPSSLPHDAGFPLQERLEILTHQLPRALRARSARAVTPSVEAITDQLALWQIAPTQPNAPRILLTAGIHGDEPAGVLTVLHLLEAQLLPDSIEWWIIPCLCPEGWLAGTRCNGSGIDPNRGFKAGVCPEVRWYWETIQKLPTPDLHLELAYLFV